MSLEDDSEGDEIRQVLMEKLRKRFKDKGKGFKKNHVEEIEEHKDAELEEQPKKRKRKLPNSVQKPKNRKR